MSCATRRVHRWPRVRLCALASTSGLGTARLGRSKRWRIDGGTGPGGTILTFSSRTFSVMPATAGTQGANSIPAAQAPRFPHGTCPSLRAHGARRKRNREPSVWFIPLVDTPDGSHPLIHHADEGRYPWRKWVPAKERVRELKDGWVGTVRPSRQPRCGFLRMSGFSISITYVMVRSAEDASRTTRGGRTAPGFRFETNTFTRSFAGTTKTESSVWFILVSQNANSVRNSPGCHCEQPADDEASSWTTGKFCARLRRFARNDSMEFCNQLRMQSRKPFRHTGEGRYPWRLWVPAFAGKTKKI